LAYHIATTYGPEAAIRDRYLETYAPDEDPVSTLGAIAKWMDDKENNSVLKPISKEKEVISKKVEEVSMK
jgi:hypothetical protein